MDMIAMLAGLNTSDRIIRQNTFYYPRVVRTFNGVGNIGDEFRTSGGPQTSFQPASQASSSGSSSPNALLAPPGTPGAAAASSMISSYGREEQGFGPAASTAPGMAQPAPQQAAESKPTGSFKSGRETTSSGLSARDAIWQRVLAAIDPFSNGIDPAQYQELVKKSTSLRPSMWPWPLSAFTPGELAVAKPDISALQKKFPKEYAAGLAAGKAEQVVQSDSAKTLAPIIDEDLPLLAIAFVKGTEQKLRVPGGTMTLTASQIKNSSLDIYNFLQRKFGGKILQTVLENAAAGIKDLPAGYVEMKRQAGLDYSVSPEPATAPSQSAYVTAASYKPQNSGGTFTTQSMDTTPSWGVSQKTEAKVDEAEKDLDNAQKAVEDAALRNAQEGTASSAAALEQAKKDVADAQAEIEKLKTQMMQQMQQMQQSAQQAMPSYMPSYTPSAGGVEPVGGGGISVPGLDITAYQQMLAQQAAKQKAGLSTGAMIGIGLGAAALLGVGIWAAMRKR